MWKRAESLEMPKENNAQAIVKFFFVFHSQTKQPEILQLSTI